MDVAARAFDVASDMNPFLLERIALASHVKDLPVHGKGDASLPGSAVDATTAP